MNASDDKNITIRDVAREAGVSVATVSRALNRQYPVSEKLRRRIEIAVAKLDFHPNAIARTLKTQNTSLIGFLVPDISRSFYTTILKGVESALRPNNYSVISCSTESEKDAEQSYLNVLLEKQIDGLIVNSTGMNDKYIARISKKIPTILCYRKIDQEEFVGDFVGCDDFGGVRDLTAHLLAMGHRKIGLVNGNLLISTGRDRYAGFRAAMRAAGLDADENHPHIRNTGFGQEDGIEAARAILESGERPTALVCTNDELTLGVLHYLRTRKIAVPRELSLVCFGDIKNRELLYIHPTIATFDLAAVGRRTGELLLERIRSGNALNCREVRFITTILGGDSVRRNSTQSML